MINKNITRFILIIVSMILFYLSLPNYKFYNGIFAWVSFVGLILVNISVGNIKKNIIINWLFFILSFSVILYIDPIYFPLKFSKYIMLGVIIFFLLSSLYYSVLLTLSLYLSKRLDINYPLTLALTWSIGELLLTVLPKGFPLSIAISQIYNIQIIQLASIFGIYIITFLIIWLNGCLATLIYSLYMGKNIKNLFFQLSICLIVILISAAYGEFRIIQLEKIRNNKQRVVIVQPNFDWLLTAIATDTHKGYSVTSDRLLYLTKLAFGKYTDNLVLWPELSVNLSGSFEESHIFSELQKFTRENQINLLLGVQSKNNQKYNNCAYLLNNYGIIDGFYQKNKLVPFYEREFVSGIELKPIFSDSALKKIGVMICFESLFPFIANNQAKQQSDVLITLANDSWYGRSNWPLLHASFMVFRCLETGLPGIHLAVNGPSFNISPIGRIEQHTMPNQMVIAEFSVSKNKAKTICNASRGFSILIFFLGIGIILYFKKGGANQF
ncbi:MAG TPA: apolipoprotein N-acyltransferase [Candidatus Margulisbacteria bacterium]|nr:MAG: apolipoprotein N-acyltransferase [Candidatus Margulisbacteria bacterium GWD2_39_127]HAR63776.1 apolipoprotein N-acyltransferase [Candidatus Margulisiibacteriota bacterium]